MLLRTYRSSLFASLAYFYFVVQSGKPIIGSSVHRRVDADGAIVEPSRVLLSDFLFGRSGLLASGDDDNYIPPEVEEDDLDEIALEKRKLGIRR